jgi:hypothetical protein
LCGKSNGLLLISIWKSIIFIAKTTFYIVVVTFQSPAVATEEDPAINEVDFVDDTPNEKKVSVNRSHKTIKESRDSTK